MTISGERWSGKRDGLSMLILDDAEDFTRVLTSVLEDEGVLAFPAATPARAREILAERRVDVVLVDLGLGDASGADFAVELLARHRATPIILMSGQVEGRRAARRLGIPFLQKPFAIAELLEVARERVSAASA